MAGGGQLHRHINGIATVIAIVILGLAYFEGEGIATAIAIGNAAKVEGFVRWAIT